MEALPVTIRQLRAATHSDRILSKVYFYTKHSWPCQAPQYLLPSSDRRIEVTVEEGYLLWGIRVVIPHRLRGKLLEELHKDNPGVMHMKSVVCSYMWWPGLDEDFKQLAKTCQSCQALKGLPPVAPLHPWIWPSKSWQRVHLNFAGPFQGVMFLVCVDAFSKWPEVRVMSTTTVQNVFQESFSVHGIPEQIVYQQWSPLCCRRVWRVYQMQRSQTSEECTISPCFEWVSRKINPVAETELKSVCNWWSIVVPKTVFVSPTLPYHCTCYYKSTSLQTSLSERSKDSLKLDTT